MIPMVSYQRGEGKLMPLLMRMHIDPNLGGRLIWILGLLIHKWRLKHKFKGKYSKEERGRCWRHRNGRGIIQQEGQAPRTG